MEPKELNATWNMLQVAVERSDQLNLAMLRERRSRSARRRLWPLKLGQGLQIAVGVVSIILAALLWNTRPAAAAIIVAGIIVQAYGIGCIMTAVLLLTALHRLDFAAPVAVMQAGLAKVRRAYGISVLVGGLSWWFLWIPFLMLLLGLAHFNLYAHAASFLRLGTAIGVAGLLGTYWLYQLARKSSDPRRREFIERMIFGSSLQKAVADLDEVRDFEAEAAL